MAKRNTGRSSKGHATLILFPVPALYPQPMSLSLHAYLVSLVTDRQLDTSKTEGGGRTKSNGDQSCIVTSVSQDNLSRENECVRAREGVRRDTCCLTAGHREANSLSRIRSRARDVSGKDIECSVKCAVISRRIHSRCFRRLSPRWEDRGDRIASKNCAEEE